MGDMAKAKRRGDDFKTLGLEAPIWAAPGLALLDPEQMLPDHQIILPLGKDLLLGFEGILAGNSLSLLD